MEDFIEKPALGAFNEAALKACQELRAIPKAGRLPKDKPETAADNLAKAALSSDFEWAQRLVDSGADPKMTLQISRSQSPAVFGAWWSSNDIHSRFDSERLFQMAAWLDKQQVGLGIFLGPDEDRKKKGLPELASGKTIKEIQAGLNKGGADKKKARLSSTQEWLALPDSAPSYNGQKTYEPGLRALLAQAKTWALDPDESCRVMPSEILDAMCKKAGLSAGSLKVLEFAPRCLGEPIGPKRWEVIAKNVLSLDGRNEQVAEDLAQALACEIWTKPLGEFAATAMVARAIREAHPQLLAEVCKASPKVDWTLKVLGSGAEALAERALGSDEKIGIPSGSFEGRTIAAFHYSRLAWGYREKAEYSRADGSGFHKALAQIPEVLQAAIAHPLPEAFAYCSATEAIATCRAHPEFGHADAKGRTLAHIWARMAKDGEGVERLRKLMGSPLASLVCAPDGEGKRPSDFLKVSSGYGANEALARLGEEVAKWEKKQLSKELGRKTKGLAQKKPSRI